MNDANAQADRRTPLTTELDLTPMPVPLRWAEEGQVVRLNNSRISLDIIISFYKRGYTAEMIGNDYPWLELSDIYLVIAFYLRNKDRVHAYLLEREKRANEIAEGAFADGLMSEEDMTIWRESRPERLRWAGGQLCSS
jgi:uncharacterized protein (DUF433 family)